MPRFLARMNCEYSLLIEAENDEQVREMAEKIAAPMWDSAWSEIEVELEDGEEVPEVGDKKEEKQTLSSINDPSDICSVCGSPNVSYAVWYRPNTEEVGESFGTPNYGDNTFCDDCDANHDLLSKGVDDEKFQALLEKYKKRQESSS